MSSLVEAIGVRSDYIRNVPKGWAACRDTARVNADARDFIGLPFIGLEFHVGALLAVAPVCLIRPAHGDSGSVIGSANINGSSADLNDRVLCGNCGRNRTLINCKSDFQPYL